MLALRLDRGSVQDFAKKAEDLCDAFRRALVMEGIPSAKADEMTIQKTVELCRANTRSDLVKSILASATFGSSKEVIAKMITESNVEVQEKQVLSYNKTSYNRNNKNKYNNYNSNYNNNKNTNHSNYNNSNRNRSHNYNKNNNKSNYYHNQQNNNNRNRNNNYESIRVAENSEAPQGSQERNLGDVQ